MPFAALTDDEVNELYRPQRRRASDRGHTSGHKDRRNR
jgi:hypothetical protein